jgi:hypothetical protein
MVHLIGYSEHLDLVFIIHAGELSRNHPEYSFGAPFEIIR